MTGKSLKPCMHNIAIYDLRVLPCTFDIATFFCTAYGYFARNFDNQEEKIHPVIIRGKNMRKPDFRNTNVDEEIDRRMHRLAMPLISLLPFLEKPVIVSQTKIADTIFKDCEVVFPKKYNGKSPELYKYYKNRMLYREAKIKDLRLINNGISSLQHAKNQLDAISPSLRPILVHERKNIVANDPSRDSNFEWLESVCEKLSGIRPVIFVPDFLSTSYINKRNVTTLLCGSNDLLHKAALIELASLNIFNSGGGSPLAYLNKKTKYIQTGVAEGSTFTRSWFEKEGIDPDINPLAPQDRFQQWTADKLSPIEIMTRSQELIE